MVVCGGLWWFVVVCGGSWWFNVMVCGGSWWFFSKILKKISCDPLFNQSETKIQYQISFWMRLCGGSWWFVVVRGGSWWFVVVRGGLMSWFVVVRGGSWWFVVVRGGFSLKFSRKYHVTHYLTNQRPRFSIKSHFEWDFVVVRGGS